MILFVARGFTNGLPDALAVPKIVLMTSYPQVYSFWIFLDQPLLPAFSTVDLDGVVMFVNSVNYFDHLVLTCVYTFFASPMDYGKYLITCIMICDLYSHSCIFDRKAPSMVRMH